MQLCIINFGWINEIEDKNNVKINNVSPMTFLRLYFYCLNDTGPPCHLLLVCPTVSRTFLDLPLMKLISYIFEHMHQTIQEIEVNESNEEYLSIISIIYSIANYSKI